MAGLVHFEYDRLSPSDLIKSDIFIITSIVKTNGVLVCHLQQDSVKRVFKLSNKINLQRVLDTFNYSEDNISNIVGHTLSFYTTDVVVKGVSYPNIIRVRYNVDTMINNINNKINM
jgi:hypothetical protein